VLKAEQQCFTRNRTQALHPLGEANELLAIIFNPRQQRRHCRSRQCRARSVMQDDGQYQESEREG
jgi:hypothetical protein